MNNIEKAIAKARTARQRLSAMLVQEVSAVDAAANEERWLILKSQSGVDVRGAVERADDVILLLESALEKKAPAPTIGISWMGVKR